MLPALLNPKLLGNNEAYDLLKITFRYFKRILERSKNTKIFLCISCKNKSKNGLILIFHAEFCTLNALKFQSYLKHLFAYFSESNVEKKGQLLAAVYRVPCTLSSVIKSQSFLAASSKYGVPHGISDFENIYNPLEILFFCN